MTPSPPPRPPRRPASSGGGPSKRGAVSAHSTGQSDKTRPISGRPPAPKNGGRKNGGQKNGGQQNGGRKNGLWNTGSVPIGRWIPAIAALAVLAVVVAAGAVGGGGKGIAGADTTPTTIATVAAAEPIVDSTSTTVADLSATGGVDYEETGLTVPSSTLPGVGTAAGAPIVKTNLASSLYIGTSGADVKALQHRLAQLGFVPGKIDGYFGEMTKEAVWAYEKLIVQTKPDKATGKVTNAMWQSLQDPVAIQPRRPGSGTHVEIYLPQQVAAVFTDNMPTLVLHISSGAAITPERTAANSWCSTVHLDTASDGTPLPAPVDQPVCGVAYTPGGVFSFKRELQGDHIGPLGGMYNPVYFNYGIAMHGASNVPLTPASHGCIRMNKLISNTFQNYVHLRDRVYVWGWDGKEPEQYSSRESTPVFNYNDPSATTTTTTSTTVVKATTTTQKSASTTTVKTTTTSAKPAPTTTVKAPTTTVKTPTTTSVAPTTAAGSPTTAPATPPTSTSTP
jgi:hypothetical protein